MDLRPPDPDFIGATEGGIGLVSFLDGLVGDVIVGQGFLIVVLLLEVEGKGLADGAGSHLVILDVADAFVVRPSGDNPDMALGPAHLADLEVMFEAGFQVHGTYVVSGFFQFVEKRAEHGMKDF